LPPDFLEVPKVSAAVSASDMHTSTSAEQLARDEAFARMFQDEAFMRELRDDPELGEYMRRQERAARQRAARTGGGAHSPVAQPSRGGAPEGGSGQSWGTFTSGLSSMGTGLRQRFAGLAARFSRSGGGGAVTVPTSSAGHAASETRGLLEETEEGDGTTEIDLDVVAERRPATRSTPPQGFDPLV
jgi:hypothetical protein